MSLPLAFDERPGERELQAGQEAAVLASYPEGKSASITFQFLKVECHVAVRGLHDGGAGCRGWENANFRPVAACRAVEKQTFTKIALPPISSRSCQPILGTTMPAGEKSLQRQREREG